MSIISLGVSVVQIGAKEIQIGENCVLFIYSKNLN